MRCVTAVAFAFLATSSPAQERLPETASFEDFVGVVRVIVVSDADQVDPQQTQARVEKRLKAYGLLVDSTGLSEEPRLVINISATHDTPRDGTTTHHNYEISVSLREPALLERSAYALIMARTWESRFRVSRFGSRVDSSPLADAIDRGVSQFIRAVLSSRAAVR